MNSMDKVLCSQRSSGKTRVAVISAVDSTIRILLFAQLKAVQKEGFEIHCICSKGLDFDFLEDQGVRMHAVKIKRSISPFTDILALWKIYQFLRKEKIEIVHTHTPKCSLLGQLAAKLAGVPIIINTVHGFYFHENMRPFVRWFYIMMEKIAAKCSTMILSQNPEDIDTAVKLGICTREKIKFLGNGVDLNKFNLDRFGDNFKKQKRKEINIPENAVVVGIIGRLVKEKGYLELFEAFREITAEHNNVWLVIIGPEEPEKADRISPETFKQYGIENQTRWLGNRDDIPELLACCDIYALPSWREGFPRSAIEAAAMDLPVVATNIRGCRQVVDDGVTGRLVPVRNSQALAGVLMELIDRPLLRAKMGRAGYQKAQKEFNEQRVCEIVLETYEECLSRVGD
jgi:glycosyltransferase involved in cell wall biosynthesis